MSTVLKRPDKKLKGSLLGLMDYDIVTYSAGYASDNTYYVAPDGRDFKYMVEVKAHCAANDLDELEVQKVVEKTPIEHCLFTVKQMIANIAIAADCNRFKGYLTGKDNFRDTIDSLYPYKGHRVSNSKPLWYDEIRDYLVTHQNGIVVDGMEADDAMSIEQCEVGADTTIICTKDKDLWMVPGWKYDFGRNNKFYVKEMDGLRWFYTQLLIGDSTDNIMGCGVRETKVYQSGAKMGEQYTARKGVGKAGAELILMACHNEADMYREVLACYLEHGLDEYDLLENANLLWMLRAPNKHWMPPK